MAPIPGHGIIRVLSALVPGQRRAEWRAEWLGELAGARRERLRAGDAAPLLHLRLRWRALGAFADALWLRRHYGAPMSLDLDLRYAARSLRRRPGFVTVVVLTLALGIGATAAIFSVVNGILLRPLPFSQPEQLVRLAGTPTDGNVEKVGPSASYPDYLDLRAQTADVFTELAAMRSWTATFTEAGATPERLSTAYVTSNLFHALGVNALVGRAILPADTVPGSEPVAVLGHSLWQGRFGADPSVVGRRILLDGVVTTVVGIAPPDVRLFGEVQLWQPLVPGVNERERGVHRLTVVGRLRPGVALATAQQRASTAAARLATQYPADNATRGALVQPLRDAIVGDVRPALLVLLGAVALVLLVGCTNLASLFLARAASREHEMAVRAALGAGQARLARQWFMESGLLSLGGAALGLAVAWGGMRALLALAPQTLPRAQDVALDLPVLGVLLGTSLATALVFGLVPVWQQRRAVVADALGHDRRRMTGGRRRGLRRLLVTGELALATMLVIGAALLTRSVWQLANEPLAVQPEHVLVAQVQLPASRYDSTARVLRFFDRLHEELAALPGVRTVSFAYEHPASAGWTSSYAIAGQAPPEQGHEPESRVRPVTPGYFAAVGLPLLAGRDVAATDRIDSPGVVVVNEAFVRRHFAGADPIGQVVDRRQAWWPGQPEQFTIVGVVADEPFMGPGQRAEPATYYPHAQFPMSDMWVVVRTAGDPAALAPALRARIWRVDPDLPLEHVTPLTALLGETIAAPRFNAALLALFAVTALLLAAIGVYGVLSYAVAERTREIGVRLALGAPRGRIVRQVVGQGTAMAFAGIALGVLAALGTTRLISAMLVGVAPRDPGVFALVVLLLSGVALGAALVPALRASRVDPGLALRAE